MPIMASRAPTRWLCSSFFRKRTILNSGTKITVSPTRKPAFEVLVVCRPNRIDAHTPSITAPSNAPYPIADLPILRRRPKNTNPVTRKAIPKRSANKLNSCIESEPIFMNR
ncbi:hypothetical protein D3C73_1176440 [compost metagenome]